MNVGSANNFYLFIELLKLERKSHIQAKYVKKSPLQTFTPPIIKNATKIIVNEFVRVAERNETQKNSFLFDHV